MPVLMEGVADASSPIDVGVVGPELGHDLAASESAAR